MLNELFGDDSWQKASSSTGLTDLIISRLTSKSGDRIAEVISIPRAAGDFKLILLTTAKKQAKDWAERVSRRINSIHGKDISKLLDVKARRQKSLKEY